MDVDFAAELATLRDQNKQLRKRSEELRLMARNLRAISKETHKRSARARRASSTLCGSG